MFAETHFPLVTSDEIVPWEDSEALAKATGMELVTIPGGDHNLVDHIMSMEYMMTERGGQNRTIMEEIIDRVVNVTATVDAAVGTASDVG